VGPLTAGRKNSRCQNGLVACQRCRSASIVHACSLAQFSAIASRARHNQPRPLTTRNSRTVPSAVSPGMDPNSQSTVTTDSGWTSSVEKAFRHGPNVQHDPSLDLVKTPTAPLIFLSEPAHANDAFLTSCFPPSTKRLSLITNTWAGSPYDTSRQAADAVVTEL
jgi:hypothetical protein